MSSGEEILKGVSKRFVYICVESVVEILLDFKRF